MLEKVKAWFGANTLWIIGILGFALTVTFLTGWLMLKFKDLHIKNLEVSVAAFKQGAEMNLKAYNELKAFSIKQDQLLRADKAEAVKRAASVAAQLERSKHAQDGHASPRLVGAFEWMRMVERNGYGDPTGKTPNQ